MNRRSSSISLLGALAVALAGGLAVLSPTPASSAPPPAPPAPSSALSTTPFGPGVVDLASGLDDGAALAAGTDLATDSVVLDGRLYFAASRTDSGSELWVTDGTPAGTRLLRDIAPGASSSWPRKLTVVGERIYFGADDGVSGRELWSTDGTAAGTTRVADIRPGAEGSDPDELTLVGERLYFAATTLLEGRELWSFVVGGAPGIVADIAPGAQSGRPDSLTALPDDVVFAAAIDGSRHAFVSRGTEDTTRRLDVEPLGRNIEPGSFTDIGSTVVFRAGDQASGPELWRTNGQAGDAFGIRDIRPGTIGSNPTRFVRLGDAALFTAETDAGAEIWRTNGTTTGTQLVHDIDPQNQSPPFNLIRVDDTVYFQAHDPLHGYELWQTRGTSASTQVAVETMPGPVSGGGVPLLSVAGRLLFGGVSGSAGYEPWVLDPDTGRARLVQDVETGPGSSNSDPIGVLGSTAIFLARHDGVDHLVAHTVAPSTTRARAKSSYSSAQAKKKRIKVKVSVAGETPRLQGTVTIVEGARVVGRTTLVGGVAKVRITKKLKPGKHRLRAVYAGSVDAQTSRSAAFTVRVRR